MADEAVAIKTVEPGKMSQGSNSDGVDSSSSDDVDQSPGVLASVRRVKKRMKKVHEIVRPSLVPIHSSRYLCPCRRNE